MAIEIVDLPQYILLSMINNGEFDGYIYIETELSPFIECIIP